jgi:transposase
MRQMERNRLDTATPTTRASIQTLLHTVQQGIDATRALIRQKIDDDPELSARRALLDSIPGLGEATIAHLLVLFSHHYGFQSAKQVVAFSVWRQTLTNRARSFELASPRSRTPCCARFSIYLR